MEIDIWYGSPDENDVDWREELKNESTDDWEYEDLPITKEVLDLLGFDPDKEDWGDDIEEKTKHYQQTPVKGISTIFKGSKKDTYLS